MKHILSITLAIALLLGLGSLAVLARPGGSSEPAAPQAAVQVESSQQTAAAAPAAPAAPNAAYGLTHIALPLGGSSIPTNASGVAAYIGPSIRQVMKWDNVSQVLSTYNVGAPFGNFTVVVGDNVFVAADSTLPMNSSFAWVGDVPPAGSTHHALRQNAFNFIMLPLDQASITNASGLAAAITGVTQVSRWDAASQSLVTYNVGAPFGNFNVTIGYPYGVLTTGTSPTAWPPTTLP